MSPPSISPPNRPAARPPRAVEAGVGRPGGLLVAALTAAIVFGIGHRLLPRQTAAAPPLPPPAPAPPPMPPPAPTSPVTDAAVSTNVDGGSQDGTTAVGENRDAAASRPDLAPTRAQPEDDDKDAKDARATPSARKPADSDQEERPADKDLAREAWRRNRPDVSTDGNKSAILIPIKGSIAGAGFRVTNRPHAVIVTLPKAASLITMRLYRVSRDGFRLLWINQAEKDADPKDGTSLKIGLGDLGDPLVEIKDDFVRITVRRSTAGAPAVEHAPAPKAAPAHAPAPAPKTAPPHDTVPASKGSAASEHPAPEHAPATEHAPTTAAKGSSAPVPTTVPKGAPLPEHAPPPAPKGAAPSEHAAAPEHIAAPEHPAAPEHTAPKTPAHPDAG